MNNLTARANVILANSLSVLAMCTGLLFVTTLFTPVTPNFDITVRDLILITLYILYSRDSELAFQKVLLGSHNPQGHPSTLLLAFPLTLSSCQVHEAQVRYTPDHMSGKRDYLDLTLYNYDLRVDMSKSFHWNVKMIFLYLVAEYENSDNAVNQVCVSQGPGLC